MRQLIEQIQRRLATQSYLSEAAVSHGVVMPVIGALGWDTSDPEQLVPEFSSGRGRVDFALLGARRRPSVFIEVKGVGRGIEGDRQLFEYAFHEGVPICVLTDGREWSFYLPSGHGSYEDRRVYQLQVEDRDPDESWGVLVRYLLKERVLSGAAFSAAQDDYFDASGRRTARETLPLAWASLMEDADGLIAELLERKTELLCGFSPAAVDLLSFLKARGMAHDVAKTAPIARTPTRLSVPSGLGSPADPDVSHPGTSPARRMPINFQMLGQSYECSDANSALIKVLTTLANRDSNKIRPLALAVRGRSRNHIAPSAAEIYPSRPDLARAVEFAPGWMIGLNIANREKLAIIRAACEIYGLKVPDDLDIRLPNA